MMKFYTKGIILLTILAAQFSTAQDLVHYWNFNDNASIATLTTPTLSLVPGAAITATNNSLTTFIDPAGGTGQNFNILNLNAQNGDVSGTHLRYNEPINGYLEFALPTTGFEDIVVRFASKRSGSGADDQLWSYSIDGGLTYTSLVTINPANGDPTLQTLDFSAITDAADNADFKLKVEFAQGAGGDVGNNRFDNFTVNGTSLGGDTNAPVVTFAPADAATNVAIDVNLTVSFNEAIRLVNNDAIDDTNVAALVELRLEDAAGALVPFDATFTGNVITINPTSDLTNGQQYFVALLPNTVEDLSDNAVVDENAAFFSTIAIQEEFSEGNFAIVAYRMSATGTDDEIAFLTFVDIPNGTNINLTDAKYSTNLIAQCSGGIVWTAGGNTCIPAGTVITIRTNALVANIGTVSGEGFGLSSNGDQVMIYTGDSVNPNYITAFTSNGWVATNTECGGSLSMQPSGLTDGTNALNTSTSLGNVSGNSANGFYNGINTGEPTAQIRNLILDPTNWTISAANTPPQTWPTWSFVKAVEVQSVAVTSTTTIEVTFAEVVGVDSAGNTANYTGIADLTSAAVAGNVVTLTYATPFAATNYTLSVANVQGFNGIPMACEYNFDFDGSLATAAFSKNANNFILYPNPSEKGIVYFNRTVNVTVFDYTGKLLLTANDTKSIDASGFASGIYLVKTSEGITKKLIVR